MCFAVTSPYFKGHSIWSHAVLLPAGPGGEPHLLTGAAPLLQDILAAISSGASLHQSSTLSFSLRLSYFSLYLRTEMVLNEVTPSLKQNKFKSSSLLGTNKLLDWSLLKFPFPFSSQPLPLGTLCSQKLPITAGGSPSCPQPSCPSSHPWSLSLELPLPPKLVVLVLLLLHLPHVLLSFK